MALIFGLAFGPWAQTWASTPESGDKLGQRNIRLNSRTPGLYLAPVENPQSPESHNFSTSHEPQAPLSLPEIQAYLANRPDLQGYRLVLIGPSVRGEDGPTLQMGVENALEELGIEASVQLIHHPKGLRERLTNLWPRREDYEKPLPSELKVALFKVIVAESLSFTVLLAPPLLRGSGVEITPEIDKLMEQIALPTGVAVAMCVMDVANMIPLVSFRRALSNHNIRLSPVERFARQLALSLFFSMNFYLLSQSPQIYETVTTSEWGALPLTALKSSLAMGTVILPASLLNMLSRTTVGTALNIWEQEGEDRRFMTSVLEAVTGLLIAPLYILSTMPVLDPVVALPLASLNPAHLGLLTIGAAGGAGWMYLAKDTLKVWARDRYESCARGLQRLGEFLHRK